MCGVRGSEGKSLASMFATRDASTIAEALRQTVQNQASVVDRELAELEELESEPWEVTGDPEDVDRQRLRRQEMIDRKRDQVMRDHNSVFANGSKLYKLDAKPGGVNINIGVGGGGSVSVEAMRGNPRAIAAEAQRQLTSEYSTVTPEMLYERVAQIRQAIEAPDQTIEGEVI